MNGVSEVGFDTVTASRHGTSDTSEGMEQRYQHGKDIIHHGIAERRESDGKIKCDDPADKTSVEDHSAEAAAKQSNNELKERIILNVREQLNDQFDIGYAVKDMTTQYHTRQNIGIVNYEVFDQDTFAPCQKKTDHSADQHPDKGAETIRADFSSK